MVVQGTRTKGAKLPEITLRYVTKKKTELKCKIIPIDCVDDMCDAVDELRQPGCPCVLQNSRHQDLNIHFSYICNSRSYEFICLFVFTLNIGPFKLPIMSTHIIK